MTDKETQPKVNLSPINKRSRDKNAHNTKEIEVWEDTLLLRIQTIL